MWRLALAMWMLAACATAPPPSPPVEHEAQEPGPGVAPAADALPADHEELAEAFAPEKPASVEPIDHNVPASLGAEGTSDPGAAARARFAEAYAQARTSLSGTDREQFVPALKALAPLAEAAGPDAQQKLFETEARLRKGAKDVAGATRAAERWLKACGPSHVDACRRKALSAFASAPERASAIRTHDACVARSEGSLPAKPPPCLGAARAFYEREGDLLMLQRALLTRASSAGADLSGLAEAEVACKQPRCAEVRRKALRALARGSLAAGDSREAARGALLEMKLAADGLPLDQRPYARTALVDQACAALDEREGAGTCRKLEKNQLGRHYFKDFSRDSAVGNGLSPDAVKTVNDHFAVLLEECLGEEAERMKAPAAERYGVKWVVLNDGRVDQVHLDRKDRDAGPLAVCLREHFALWRYPRFRGEWQHVEQHFIVTAREQHTYSLSAPR